MALPRTIRTVRHTGLQISWVKEGTDLPVDLTAATISGVIHDQNSVSRSITGFFAVLDPENGVFRWTFSEEDVGQAGRHEVQFKADYGTSHEMSFVEKWVVEEIL